MDDSYIIHQDKGFLREILFEIISESRKIGITINDKKTRICKLSERWRFMQVQYSLTETGRIIHKINPKNITRMRRKMKKLAGVLSESEFNNWIKSWLCGYAKYMSKKQRDNIYELSAKLKSKYKNERTD